MKTTVLVNVLDFIKKYCIILELDDNNFIYVLENILDFNKTAVLENDQDFIKKTYCIAVYKNFIVTICWIGE